MSKRAIRTLPAVTRPSNPAPSAMRDDLPPLVQVRPYSPIERFGDDMRMFEKKFRRKNPGPGPFTKPRSMWSTAADFVINDALKEDKS